jgi:protein-S-isoprenylcysteine O-methyltransferase Ste14
MTEVNRKTLFGMASLLIELAASLFLPAWTFAYWQAWTFIAVFYLSALAITLDLMRRDPALLARRVRAGPSAEADATQRIVQTLVAIFLVATLIVSALDHRFAWSSPSWQFAVIGDALIVLGFAIVFLVFRENSFASATIEIGAGQKVVTSGPYALVRHPMYFGAIVLIAGAPLALGSWWGLVPVILATLALLCRLVVEERFLASHLDGYRDYQAATPHRLLPFVW